MRKQEQTKKKTAVKNRQNRDYYAKHREEKKLYQNRRKTPLVQAVQRTREDNQLDCFCDQKFANTSEGRKLQGVCLKQHLEEAKMRHQFSDQQTIMSITSWLDQKKHSLWEIREEGGSLTVRQCGRGQCLSCDDLVTEEGQNTPG